jgi:pimeloyl-ACP methyl ester carboxylesterase
MKSCRRALVLYLLALGAIAPAAGAQACDVAPGARCGSVEAPLDASGAVPGTQHVGYAVLPATGTATGTLAVALGGPGQASTSAARVLAKLLEPLRGSYDLLLVDQRGTGLSGELKCPGLLRKMTAASVTACADALGPARQFLTPRADAGDVEAVRAALGIEKISLLGVSYGTAVAGYYARLYPQHTDRVVLDSPEPIEGADALDSLRELALPRVLREVCWPPSCRSFLSADPVASLARLAAKLRRKPLTGTVITATGKPVKARFTSTELYALAAASDIDPFLRTRIPSAVASALKGDAAPLLRLAAGTGSSDVEASDVNPVRLLATNCIDDRLPWDPASPAGGRAAALTAEIVRRPKASWGPFSPTSVLALSVATACTAWPSTPGTQKVPSQGPDVPVLVLAGREDLRTPLEDARRTALQYPNAKVLAVPDTGHSVLGSDETPCAITGLTAFLAGRPVANCVRTARLPDLFPYVPASASKLLPVPELHGAEGRTATAVGATLLDALRRATALELAGGTRSGGLRAGTLRIRGLHATLAGYSVVKGVTVSGTVPLTTGGRGALVVGGPDAVPARLAMRGTRLTGVLGTHRVRLRVVL